MNQQPRKWHDLLDGWTGWLIILLTDRQSKRVYGDSLIGVHYWLTKQANLSDQWLAVIWFPAAVSSPVLLSSHLTRAVIFSAFDPFVWLVTPPPPPPISPLFFRGGLFPVALAEQLGDGWLCWWEWNVELWEERRSHWVNIMVFACNNCSYLSFWNICFRCLMNISNVPPLGGIQ